ncbi:MAG: SynChlorMet cassette radical SAM/SPASM protein ScmF [Negativicutes bacterium]|jgi:SynChlorMet cassette radical SAM/SPASM protein ScmF
MNQNTDNVSAANSWRLNSIYFYLTDGCNLNCRHCWLAPLFTGNNEPCNFLDLDLLKDIVRQGKEIGLQSVKLTGGEPLLHPQFEAIVDFLQAEELGITVETNGVLLTEELAKKLVKSKAFHLSVSLDGVDADTHEAMRRVKDSFAAALRGIANMVTVGYKPQIIMSLTPDSAGQMEPMVRLAEEIGARSVKFNLIQSSGRGEKLHADNATLSVAQMVELGKWVEDDLSPNAKVGVFYSHPAAFKPLHRLFGSADGGCNISGCGIKGIIGVIADGSYALCGIGLQIRELIFGNAKTDKLADVWNNSAVLQAIRADLPDKLEGVCADCVLKSRCIGSCVAQNYHGARSLYAPFWYCQTAYEQGLFPASRLLRVI